MKRRSTQPPRYLFLVLLLSLVPALLVPTASLAAKTLASEALADAVAGGSIDAARQDLMMDFVQKQKYEFDEKGIEALGKGLCDQGKHKQGVEILQLNQIFFSDSPAAANSLGDAYRDSGDDISARMYYDMALRLDPDNVHAKEAIAEQGEGSHLAMGAMGGAEVDLEAMQAALAQSGVEMSPEQMEEMQQAMAQMEAHQEDPGAVQAREKQQAEARQNERERRAAPSAEPVHESEFCEVLHRFNSQKRIEEEIVRARVEGEYGAAGAPNRKWNVETACGDFLVAVPLWADVSPPIMEVTGERSFSDAMGGTWVFQMEGGQATSVVYTDSAGTVQDMKRLGNPRSFD